MLVRFTTRWLQYHSTGWEGTYSSIVQAIVQPNTTFTGNTGNFHRRLAIRPKLFRQHQLCMVNSTHRTKCGSSIKLWWLSTQKQRATRLPYLRRGDDSSTHTWNIFWEIQHHLHSYLKRRRACWSPLNQMAQPQLIRMARRL